MPLIRPNPNELRAFFALTVNEVTLTDLARLRDQLLRKLPHRDNARPIANAALHLTLKFLGNIPKAAVVELSQALAAALPRQPLAAKLERLVVFGNPRHARVVAVELSESTGELTRCAELLDAAATAIGVPRETRTFVPHLTLIRLHAPDDVRHWLEQTPFESRPITFETAKLYESELTATGSLYHVQAEYALPVKS